MTQPQFLFDRGTKLLELSDFRQRRMARLRALLPGNGSIASPAGIADAHQICIVCGEDSCRGATDEHGVVRIDPVPLHRSQDRASVGFLQAISMLQLDFALRRPPPCHPEIWESTSNSQQFVEEARQGSKF